MKPRSVAVLVVLLVAAGCGSAADVSSGRAPTTIPLFDVVDSTADPADGSMDEVSTTDVADPAASTTGSTAPGSTAPPSTPDASSTIATTATTTIVDPNAEYCASYNRLAGIDTAIEPGDSEATASVFAAREAAWTETAALAPPRISAEAQTVRTFVSALRQLLAENGNDLGVVLPDAVALEAELGADVAQVLVEQFGLLVCETETSVPAEETAVFYANLLDTPDRRSVLVDLLSTDLVLSMDEAACFVAGATAEMMFPLTGAPSTPAQEASLGQLLGSCQLSAGGS